MLELAVESWIWYGFVVAITVSRFVSRTLLFGSVKKLQIDDWVMLFALCTYTTFLVSINIVADTSSNLLPPGYDVNKLTPEEISEREYGSKLILVVEQCQCFTIWAVKACLLIMYYRLFQALREALIVKILAGYTAFGFIFMEVFYLGVWCRPFHNYWAVPTPNPQCSAATDHLITNAVFNISSDLIMLLLSLQMLIRSHLPLKRKLILCGIFGLGIFVILSAVLNKYYSFNNPYGTLWTFWYVRESSTVMIVANLPFTWTLLRRIKIFNVGAFDKYGTPSRIPYHSQRSARARRLREQGSWPIDSRVPSINGMNPDGSSSASNSFSVPNKKRGSKSSRSSTNSKQSSKAGSSARDSTIDIEVRRNLIPTTNWRDRELYGRMDREALEDEPWDLEADIGLEDLKSPMKPAFFGTGRRRSQDQDEEDESKKGIGMAH